MSGTDEDEDVGVSWMPRAPSSRDIDLSEVSRTGSHR